MRIGIASLIAWDFIQQRPHRVAGELAARGHQVFYIEPADLTRPRADLLASGLLRSRTFRPVAPNLWAFRPPIVPPFRVYSSRIAYNRYLAPLLAFHLRRLRLDFLLVLSVEFAEVLQWLRVPFAYDHVDDTQFMEHIDTDRFVSYMDALKRDSAFNMYIQEPEAERDPKGLFFPNGVDPEVFQPYPRDEIFDAVVFSNIAKWFDMDSILASRKRILLIGPMDLDGGDNRQRFFAAARPNLSWMPRVERSVANHWLARAAVGLVPFKQDHPVVHYAMPIKILEYFAAGLPVVTFRNAGIARTYGDRVTFYGPGTGDPDLDEAIDLAKRCRCDQRDLVERFRWDRLVPALERRIARAVASRR